MSCGSHFLTEVVSDRSVEDVTDLWGEELRRSAERSRPVTVTHALLAKPEVGDLDVALCVKQQIVQLQVSEIQKPRLHIEGILR